MRANRRDTIHCAVVLDALWPDQLLCIPFLLSFILLSSCHSFWKSSVVGTVDLQLYVALARDSSSAPWKLTYCAACSLQRPWLKAANVTLLSWRSSRVQAIETYQKGVRLINKCVNCNINIATSSFCFRHHQSLKKQLSRHKNSRQQDRQYCKMKAELPTRSGTGSYRYR